MRRIPFAVIGGFLGAGKTTLVNHVLAANDGVRYAVLVNDFGEICIDSRLIRRHDGRTIELSNGCICCSMVNGFVQSMVELMRRPAAIDRILVEASGVSEPGRIMDVARIDSELAPCRVAVVVDAAGIERQLADPLLSELVLKQIGQADLLFVNKSDLVSLERIDLVVDLLAGMAARTHIVRGREGSLEPALLFETPRDSDSPRPSAALPVPPSFHTIRINTDAAIERSSFERFCTGLDPTVIRGKGLIHFTDDAGRVWKWQKVGAKSNLEPLDLKSDLTSRVVVIASCAEGLPDANALAEYFPGNSMN